MITLDQWTTSHLPWIHQIEGKINRRLTEDELSMLMDLEIINDWDTRLREVNTLHEEINTATDNFIEGITGEVE